MLRRLTDKPIKISFPGLQALALGSVNRFYSDVRDLTFDLARIYNEEFKELARAGVDVIQLDEFTWHYGVELGDWELEAFNAAVEGVDADIHVHVCWGNYLGTSGFLPSQDEVGQPTREGEEYVLALRQRGATTARSGAIFPRASGLTMTALNYEIAHWGSEDLEPLGHAAWDKPFIAGVIDVKSVEIDQADEVADRIRACLKFVPAERLGLTTDCGLINLPRRVAHAKLRALVEGAKIVRAELGASR